MPSHRRDFIKGFGAVGAFGAAALSLGACGDANVASGNGNGGNGAAAGPKDFLSGPYVDLSTGEGNKIAYARTQGNLDESEQKTGWFKGYVMGVRPGEKIRDLFGFAGWGVSRLQQNPDGSIAKILREVGYYTDLRSGEVLEEWQNPYTNETVSVVPIANDPFNYVISDYFPEPPQFGGLNEEKPPQIPFVLPWTQRGDRIDMEIHIHLYYPNALDPAKWVRESSGAMVRVSEFFAFHVDGPQLQNADLTTLPYHGVWNRTTPWLPWMLMGQAPGFCQYAAFMGAGEDLEQVHDRALLDYAEKHHAKYFTAPETYDPETPSLSSLELYAIERTPAPPKQET
ncbi:DUF1838 family protein [Candidatus Foliamicus sp.]